jgi:hypothetical protein
MSFLSFIKSIFVGESDDEAALDAARARHGIKIDEKTKKAANKSTTAMERFAENFDAWEELRRYRSNFFFGSWITRKFHPFGEDKVKKQLEDLEKKRQAEAKLKQEKEERKKLGG